MSDKPIPPQPKPNTTEIRTGGIGEAELSAALILIILAGVFLAGFIMGMMY